MVFCILSILYTNLSTPLEAGQCPRSAGGAWIGRRAVGWVGSRDKIVERGIKSRGFITFLPVIVIWIILSDMSDEDSHAWKFGMTFILLGLCSVLACGVYSANHPYYPGKCWLGAGFCMIVIL